MWAMKRSKGPFSVNSYNVVQIYIENVFLHYNATLLVCLQAHLAAWGVTINLFHSSDLHVTPYIQDIHWLDEQKQLFPVRAESGRNQRSIEQKTRPWRMSWTLRINWKRLSKATEHVGCCESWVKVGISVAFFRSGCFCACIQRSDENSGDCRKYPFILRHQLLHIPNQKAPLSQCFVRAQGNSALHWRDADRLSCLNGFSRAAEMAAQQ